MDCPKRNAQVLLISCELNHDNVKLVQVYCCILEVESFTKALVSRVEDNCAFILDGDAVIVGGGTLQLLGR